MLKVGVTGNIGSGKTTVCELFKAYGIPVYNADSEAKKIMSSSETIIADIKKHFGEEAYINNQFNSAYIANIVFSDFHQLHILNAITHPAIIEHAMQWMNQQTTPYAIKEAALIFESGSAEGLDVVIGVEAPNNLRIKRIMKRDSLDREEVLKRMDKQIDQEMKMNLCDYVIKNDEKSSLIEQVEALHKKLVALANDKVNNK